MHEMVHEGNTEQMLAESCVKVGEHLYVKPGSEIVVAPIGDKEKEYLQIVFSMGGIGTRLRHITEDKYSKHLIQVNSKPISKHVFDLWSNNGFRNFCFLIDNTHRGKSITDYYKGGEHLSAAIKYSTEHIKLSSGGAIRQAIETDAITKSFINHYPDDLIVNYPNFADDFAKIFISAMRAGYHCVIICVPGKLYPYGVIEDEAGKAADFVEKPFITKDTNTGIFGMSEKAFALIKQLEPNKEIKIERTVLKQIAQSGKMLKVLLPTEYWIPVNDILNLNKFAEIVKRK